MNKTKAKKLGYQGGVGLRADVTKKRILNIYVVCNVQGWERGGGQGTS